MFRLIMPCKNIPDGKIVCKPTGSKQYLLHEQFPIKFYGEHSKEITVALPAGVKYLVPNEVEESINVNIIMENQLLAVLFDDVDELTDFVNKLEGSDRE